VQAIRQSADPPVTADDVILTGDRPTGPLHLGHLVGSLQSRVSLQHVAAQYVLVADLQALSDHAKEPHRIANAVLEVVADYLAVGLDPMRTTFALQSEIPELAELTVLYLDLVTVARLQRNPTVREEIRQRGMQRSIPAGFLAYPVSQAADITGFRGTVVPVGEDQIPVIEQSNEIVRAVNRLADAEILPRARPLLSGTSRLPGIAGDAKMSKTAGNALSLSATPDEIRAAVGAMYTDPQHIHAEDPGHTEGNVVFAFLDAFDPDRDGLEEVRQRYRRGGVGDSVTKRRLEQVLLDLLEPIRERRAALAADRERLSEVLLEGTERARYRVRETLELVRSAFGLRVRRTSTQSSSNSPSAKPHALSVS
jgi:tryptophanyl-tRNA synthetase